MLWQEVWMILSDMLLPLCREFDASLQIRT